MFGIGVFFSLSVYIEHTASC